LKHHERVLVAVEWYQNGTYFDPLVCRNDGTKLIGRAYLGSPYLECPQCGLRQYEIPPYVFELYHKENDIPTTWQLQEAQMLAEKLGRTVPESVIGSWLHLGQYIKATKGKVIELGEANGQKL
jgi:hypothetical protein